jgi:hypothetical protein
VACDHLVESVDERRGPKSSQHASERSSEPDLDEERDAASGVAGNGRPVSQDEPPAFVTCFFGDGSEEAAGLVVGQWQQRQLFASVERGDDPRRPPAELSGAGIEQNGARELGGIHVLSHAG